MMRPQWRFDMVDEKDMSEAPCPRCGADAQWSFSDAGKTRVEVICPNCGRFEIPREAFDQAETERIELDNRP